MRAGTTFISVWNCRAAVSRYETARGGALTFSLASNWETLEDDAIKAVEAHGGAINLSGHYSCPAELAERAEFPSHDIPNDLISLSEAAALAYPAIDLHVARQRIKRMIERNEVAAYSDLGEPNPQHRTRVSGAQVLEARRD
jgi:hypothetical protein